VDQDPERLRRALREIEELIAEAARNGDRVDRWLEELADELRASIQPAAGPAPAAFDPGEADSRRVAGRIRSDPARSIGAQARLDPRTLRLLKH
jgi:hypothetical protein